MRKLAATLASVLLIVGSAAPASAHAQLIKATPGLSAKVFVVPKQVKLMFTDELIDLAGGNSITVTDPRGRQISVEPTQVLGNQLVVNLRASKLLGRYIVSYRVVSEDGHPIAARYSFWLSKKPTR